MYNIYSTQLRNTKFLGINYYNYKFVNNLVHYNYYYYKT